MTTWDLQSIATLVQDAFEGFYLRRCDTHQSKMYESNVCRVYSGLLRVGRLVKIHTIEIKDEAAPLSRGLPKSLLSGRFAGGAYNLPRVGAILAQADTQTLAPTLPCP